MQTVRRTAAGKLPARAGKRAQRAPQAQRKKSGASRGRGAASPGRALMLWRQVSAGMRLRDLNLHLQGLYAELGKAVYEAATRRKRPGGPAATSSRELMARIGEMRKQISRLTVVGGAVSGGSRSRIRKRI